MASRNTTKSVEGGRRNGRKEKKEDNPQNGLQASQTTSPEKPDLCTIRQADTCPKRRRSDEENKQRKRLRTEEDRPKRKRLERTEEGTESKTDSKKEEEPCRKKQREDTEFIPEQGNQWQEARNSKLPTIPLTDGAALTANSFKYHCMLGEGSYGKVMMATDTVQNQQVAVKIIKKSKLVESKNCLVEGKVLEFSNESRFLIHGYAAFHTQSYVYYVMELARGGTLHSYINRSTPSLTNIATYSDIFIAAELVCGLQFLHSKGVIHRDVKPINILLAGDGHAKIADFGIAVKNIYGKVRAKGRAGTTGFKPPEMLRGLPYNQSADWFAFGVTLYKMITRKLPFDRATVAGINEMILKEEPAYKGLGHKSADILRNLLCKDESRRLGLHGNIKQHPFFSVINWVELEAGRLKSPLKLPKDSLHAHSTKEEPAPYSEALLDPVDEKSQAIFNKICFVCPIWAASYHNTHMQPDIVPAQVKKDCHTGEDTMSSSS